MKRNTTKYAILGLLTIKPMSGYEIKKLIKNSLAYFWSESNGQLYPALNQLMKDGWISLLENPSTTKKMTNNYAITDSGWQELQSWMRQGEEKSVRRDENLLKLFFGSNISKEETIRRLKDRKKKLLQALKEYQEIANDLEKDSDSPHCIYWALTVDYGITNTRSAIDWYQKSIRILEKKQS